MKQFDKRGVWLGIALAAMGIGIALTLHACNKAVDHKSVLKTRTDTIQGPSGTSTITVTTGGNMDPAAADSMMKAAMEEMRQTDSMMQAMMNGMMGRGPFAGDGDDDVQSVAHQRQVHQRVQSDVATLVGHIGNQELMMALNLKDPQNVKGSGNFVDNGKERAKFHLLGIQDGANLTVSIYSTNNQLQGILAGVFDGMTFEGSYLVNGKETPFRLNVR